MPSGPSALDACTISEVINRGLGTRDTTDYFSIKATVGFIKSDRLSYPACGFEGCQKKVCVESRRVVRREREREKDDAEPFPFLGGDRSSRMETATSARSMTSTSMNHTTGEPVSSSRCFVSSKQRRLTFPPCLFVSVSHRLTPQISPLPHRHGLHLPNLADRLQRLRTHSLRGGGW